MKPLSILIVEDEAIIGWGMQMELERAGYEACQIVATGEEAIDCVIQNHPDIVLMDNHLAGKMDGVEAARIILARQALPIIFMSGYDTQDMVKRAQGLNPLGYLSKPVIIYQLLRLIESIAND